jgi:geranylgeranyl pyrophosphate synthase
VDRQTLGEILNIPVLARQLEKVDARMLKIIGDSELASSAHRLIAAGGKRLRPALVIASYRVGQVKSGPEIIEAAAAVELVHLASIIHDDIIDGDIVRRGVESVSAKDGISQALLLGDFLIVKAGSTLTSLNPQASLVLSESIATMARGLSAELSRKYRPFDELYLQIIQRKTAALISAACRIGAVCAGLPEAKIRMLTDYGRLFGASFQIIDDIQDGDIPKQSQPQALGLLKQNNDAAARLASQLDAGKAARGLAKLPDSYLGWALKKT